MFFLTWGISPFSVSVPLDLRWYKKDTYKIYYPALIFLIIYYFSENNCHFDNFFLLQVWIKSWKEQEMFARNLWNASRNKLVRIPIIFLDNFQKRESPLETSRPVISVTLTLTLIEVAWPFFLPSVTGYVTAALLCSIRLNSPQFAFYRNVFQTWLATFNPPKWV